MFIIVILTIRNDRTNKMRMVNSERGETSSVFDELTNGICGFQVQGTKKLGKVRTQMIQTRFYAMYVYIYMCIYNIYIYIYAHLSLSLSVTLKHWTTQGLPSKEGRDDVRHQNIDQSIEPCFQKKWVPNVVKPSTNGGFQLVMGIPQKRWMLGKSHRSKWMMTEVSP